MNTGEIQSPARVNKIVQKKKKKMQSENKRMTELDEFLGTGGH